MPSLQQTVTKTQPTVAPTPGANAPMVYVGASGELTTADIQGLRVKMNDLRDELQDAASRRRTVSDQLRSAEGSSRVGLESRLSELDGRIIALEKDITSTGAQLRAAPPSLLASTAPPGPEEAFQLADKVASEIVPLVAIMSVFVFAPIALAIARLIWKRATATSSPRVAATDQPTQQKLDQLQQAVDTIAIEVERISEGQRFVTKIMSDRSIGAGVAESLRAPLKSAVPRERG